MRYNSGFIKQGVESQMGQKLGIIGVGHVGNHVFTQAMNSELFSDIVVIDSREEFVLGQMYDQVHATGLFSQNNISVAANDYSQLEDADVIIISATHVYPTGEIPVSRQELLEMNVPIFKDVTEKIMEYTTDALLIWITNPVDTAVYLCSEVFGYPREKVMGTGTLLDTSRLKYILGKHYGVSPNSVSAYMLGEHGFTALACLSRVSIAGIPYEDLSDYFPEIEPLTLEDVTKKVVDSAYDVFHNKGGVTEVAIAQSALTIARSILLDEKAIYTVSSVLPAGTYGAEETISVSLPSVIGKDGVEKTMEVSLPETEEKLMDISVREIMTSIQLGKKLSEV